MEVGLNHPKTIPNTTTTNHPLACGKTIFCENSPWCQKCWGRLPRIAKAGWNVVSKTQPLCTLVFLHIQWGCNKDEMRGTWNIPWHTVNV